MTGALCRPVRRRAGPRVGGVGGSLIGPVIVGAALLMLAGCGTGTLATPDTAPSGGSAPATSAPSSAAGPTLIVTVPELPLAEAVSSAAEAPSRSVGEFPAAPAASDNPTEAPAPEPSTEAAPTVVPAPAAEPTAEPAPPAVTAPPPAPAGDQLPISLANCDGCSLLATRRGVTGDLSAALVGTQAGRAILLSVGPEGLVKGVIGVPYGASFAAPADGVLRCDGQARCAVQGTQTDGRAILSAFELTGNGAWRDVSGDDAFPSATERAGVIDLGGELGLAVQDQGDGAAVWMLYQWSGDRFTVAGCAPDADSPPSAGQVSQDLCLS